MRNSAITSKQGNKKVDSYSIEWHELETWMKAPRVQKMKDSTGKDSTWHGSASLEQSLILMRDGWQDGVDMINHGLTHELKDSGVIRSEVWETAPVGAFAIIPLYCAGVNEHMLLPNDDQEEPIVNLIVDIACASMVSSNQMKNRGVAIASLINHIEQSGKRVRLQARWATTQENFGYNFLINVKEAHEHMDMSRVAFAIINPSFSRRVCFKLLETVAHRHMGNYGSVLRIDPKSLGDDTFHISEIDHTNKSALRTAQSAHDHIHSEWKKELDKHNS